MDLISRKDAIKALNEDVKWLEEGYYGVSFVEMRNRVLERLNKLPSAQPERKTGRWIDTGSGQECSECHEIQYGYDSGRFYCSNCGASMTEDGE